MQDFMKVLDSFSGNSTVTYKCPSPCNAFAIYNKGNGDLTFTINNITITVPQGIMFEDNFATFNQVTITTSVAFEANVKGF